MSSMKLSMRVFDFFRGSPLLSGASAAFVTNGLGLFIGFGLQVLLARAMGVTHYGGYTYVLSWMSVLVILGTSGFDSTSLRFVAAYRANEDWGPLRGLLTRAVQIVIFKSAMVTCVGYLLVITLFDHLDPDLRLCFAIGFFLIPVWALTNVILSSLQGLKRVVSARAPHIVLRPLIFAALVWLAWNLGSREISASFAIELHILAAITGLVLGAFLLQNALSKELGNADPTYESGLWIKTAYGLMFVSGMHMILNQIDILMIGAMRSVEEVATYSVAARISILILFGLQAINTIAAPMISEAYSSRSTADLQKLVSKVALWIFLVTTPFFLGAIIFGLPILHVFGPEFSGGYIPLVLLALGQLVNACVGPVGFILNMTGHERTSLKILAITITVNIALNIPAIYFHGVNGAAAATGFSIALRNILMWRASRSLLSVDSSILCWAQMRLTEKRGDS